jgi:hypothetical protein
VAQMWRKQPFYTHSHEFLSGKKAEAEYWSEWKQRMNERKEFDYLGEKAIDVSCILKPGVYKLIYDDEIVFIGRAKCMLSVIASHRAMAVGQRMPEWFPIKGIRFNDFAVWPMSFDKTLAVMNELIAIHKPKHNIHSKPALPINLLNRGTEGAAPRITRRI